MFHLIEVLFVFRPLSVALSYRKISPAKIQNSGSDVDAAEFIIFSRRRKCADDSEINILSTVATFMRGNLIRNQGYYECSSPAYSIDEFKSNFRMTRVTMEALCREVQATGRIPQQQAFGRTPIPLRKHVLAFLWFMANSEVIRSVSDRFDIALSSLNRIIHRLCGALVDLRHQCIKWLKSKLYFMLFLKCV